MIKKYLNTVYKDGARGEAVDGKLLYDCWGLCRAARVELYGRKLLDSRGGEYQHDPQGFTDHFKQQSSKMVELNQPAAGCVVAVLRRRSGICMHVGLVVHDINNTGQGLHVLEINPSQNARLIPLYRFREAYPLRELKFYDDTGLSEQA